MEYKTNDTEMLGYMLERMVEQNVRERINEEIKEKVKQYEEELVSRRDEYIAEVMKGIRIAHETRLGEVTYRIVFENEIVRRGN